MEKKIDSAANALPRRTQFQLQIARGLQIRGKRRKKRLRFHISVRTNIVVSVRTSIVVVEIHISVRTSIVVGALLRRFGLHSSWCFTAAMAAPVKELSATRQKEKGEIPRKTENQLQEGRKKERRKVRE